MENVAETRQGIKKGLMVYKAMGQVRPDNKGSLIGKEQGVLGLEARRKPTTVNNMDSFSLALGCRQLPISSSCRRKPIYAFLNLEPQNINISKMHHVPCLSIQRGFHGRTHLHASSLRSPNLSTQAVGTVLPSCQSFSPFVIPVSTHNVPPKPPSIPNWISVSSRSPTIHALCLLK